EPLALLFTLGQTEVAAEPDGTITVAAFKDFSGAVKKWRNVGPLLYREVGGQTHLKFVATKDGDIDFFQSDDFLPVEELQRVHGLAQLNLLKLLGLGTIAACSLALVVWLRGGRVRRRFGRKLEMSEGQARLRLGARLGALLYIMVIAGWIGLITAVSTNEFLLFNGGLNTWMTLLYVLGVLAIAGGIAMAANGVLRLIGGPGGCLARTGDLLLGLAGLYGIWAILYFGLANFQLNL